MKRTLLILALIVPVLQMWAQPQRLTLDECRDRAVTTSKDLDQARTRIDMAGYDRDIALANYLPNVSAIGAYMYNDRDIALLSDRQLASSRIAGAALQDGLTNLHLNSLAGVVGAIAEDIERTLHPDLHNVWVGAVTVQQPVFMGGKIVYSNKMAALAEDLAKSQYDQQCAQVLLDVDQAYWQIVSIAGKKRLAEAYADLLHDLQADVAVSVAAGVMTESDALQIKVKVGEADMLLTKAANGLKLSKMLLCQRIGLPLDSEIVLADEDLDIVPQPERGADKPMDDIWADRPETRSLDLASQIYDAKAKVVRADLMPKVALTANWIVSNPNIYDGFQNSWNGGMLNAGVMVKVPIFHGQESMNRYRKAQAEATLYRDQLEDAKQKVELQVTRERKAWDEALEKLRMAEDNLASAEENLRTATVGFEAGVISTNTVLSAQTAWLSASSDCLDASTELQMTASKLRQAEGTK